jgi:hypothetical protein
MHSEAKKKSSFNEEEKQKIEEKLYERGSLNQIKGEVSAMEKFQDHGFTYEGASDFLNSLSADFRTDPLKYLSEHSKVKKMYLDYSFNDKYDTNGPVHHDYMQGKFTTEQKRQLMIDAKEINSEIEIGGEVYVVKKVVTHKRMSSERQELDIMLKAKVKGLPGLEPVLLLSDENNPEISFLFTKKLQNVKDLDEFLKDEAETEAEYQNLKSKYKEKTRQLAEAYLREVGIGKNWQPKDLLVDMDTNSARYGELIPLDWERVTPDNQTPNSGSWFLEAKK